MLPEDHVSLMHEAAASWRRARAPCAVPTASPTSGRTARGTTPREAYFVKCDAGTTTHNDISLGVVSILAGFAPLKPAEFVITRIRQRAGQVAA